MFDPVTTALTGGIGLVVWFALAFFALGVLPENRRPQTAMAWVLLILLTPLFGLVVFGFLGAARIGRSRHHSQERANREIAARMAEYASPVPPSAPEYVPPIVELNQYLASMPMTGSNHVEFISDYRGAIEAMIAAIDSAEKYVHVEFYIMALDDMTRPFFDALDAAAARGVDVRLLFDHLGTRGIPGYRGLLARLRASSYAWQPMMPLLPLRGRFRRPDLRNHRKLLVVDDTVGFTGSLNLTHPSYNKPKNLKVGREWVELWMRLEGDVVASIDAVFAADWYVETNEIVTIEPHPADPLPRTPEDLVDVSSQLVPSGPGYVAENNLRLFTSLLYGATRRLSITSPYFVPDDTLLYAITTAAQRGLDVELFVGEESDQFMVGHAQASYYRELLEAGVRIWLYPAPLVLHAKFFTVDDDVAVVGTSNMDMRSFALNYEMSLMLLGSEVVEKVSAVQDQYRALSRELTLTEWDQRPWRTRWVDNVMRLTATLQ